MVRTLLLTLVLAATATAQPGPLVWERVGEIENLSWAGFDGDTLVAVRYTATPLTLVLPPGATSFTQVFHPNLGAQGLVRIGGDTLAYRSLSNVFRTTDGGASWDRVIDSNAYSDPVVLASGALLVGTPGNQDGNGSLGLRSTDRGATWAFVGLGNNVGIATSAFVEVPPSPAAPSGAIVAAGFNGIAYSTDDGRTWTATVLYGPLAYAADTAALVAGTNRVVAVVGSNLGPLLVYASDDGGVTWASLGPPPLGTSGISSRLLPTPDGALYLYETYGDDDGRDGLPVWRSVDGGATWADVGRVWTEWSSVPRSIAVGPDGRLYAAAGGRLSPGVPGQVGGVFRTVAPVWAVASETQAPKSQALSVAVFPNPTASGATVEVSHAARIVIVDALGREVAAWDGASRVRVDTSGWGPGAYVVRVVSASGAQVTAGLAVAR